jgi:hypothetical protein
MKYCGNYKNYNFKDRNFEDIKNELSNRKYSAMKDWISVKDRLPTHKQIVLVFAQTNRGVDGYGVATFIDSVKMNEELSKTAYANECVDTKKHPYYFVSQEVKQHTFNNVSHWMELSTSPFYGVINARKLS